MSDGRFGLKEVIAMGVGGMVSGGIFAVLGVAMHQAGNAVPLSFLLAGILTLLTAYSYVKLTLFYGEEGGAFSFIEHAISNKHVAGFFGWVLVAGYIGVMAMYAYAFGAYSTGLLADILGYHIPFMRPLLSMSIIVLLVSINLVGVEESGLLEDILVFMKTGFLLLIAIAGIAAFDGSLPTVGQFFNQGIVSPITGFAIIFVAYEGFQLLCYDYNEIKDVERTLPRGMYASIGIAILLYILVSVMATLYLSPEMVVQHKEYALAQAVKPFLFGAVGFTLVVITALQSTASGINATLFGASRLARKIATEKELPRLFSFRNQEGIPVYSLIIIGGLTAIMTAVGSLEQITEFGSIAFLIADGAANYANLRLYKRTGSNPIIPALGFIGTVMALPIVIHHLYVTETGILLSIAGIFAVLLLLEFLYIEREEIDEVEDEIEEGLDELEDEVKDEIDRIED